MAEVGAMKAIRNHGRDRGVLGARQRHRHRSEVQGPNLCDLPTSAYPAGISWNRYRFGGMQADRGTTWWKDMVRI